MPVVYYINPYIKINPAHLFGQFSSSLSKCLQILVVIKLIWSVEAKSILWAPDTIFKLNKLLSSFKNSVHIQGKCPSLPLRCFGFNKMHCTEAVRNALFSI